MYIKSVIIDGFKSYGRRTEITGFDSEFTAITGLNGTGKSNILDSICFVLGIMNLGQVRATSLQDLVYKSGQAGVTKATVTLIFDNSNPNQCPIGYEKCREISVTRQIVVGGKNKYLINGKLVQNKKVSDFFCSVQLNVNNPNFLIMQGRITKVLNMKPQEILSMIEEAAGTSMYETKREATTKLIEKKDAKVRETNTLLQEEVEPKLEKLRQERSAYNEFQRVCRDIEYLTRIYISHRYLKFKEALQTIETNINKLDSYIKNCEEQISKNNEECVRIENNSQDIRSKIDSKSGGALKQLEYDLTLCSENEAKAMGNYRCAQDVFEQEEKVVSKMKKDINSDELELKKNEAKMSKVGDLFENLKTTCENDEYLVQEAQARLLAAQGLSSKDDDSLHTQKINLKREINDNQAKSKSLQVDMNLHSRHLERKLNELENTRKAGDELYENYKKKEARLETELKKINEKLVDLKTDNEKYERIREQKTELIHQIRSFKQQYEVYHPSRFDLIYKDPQPNFDRRKVRGMVGKLITVRDEKMFLPLMMAAGGSIYSYVVEDDVTSKQILQRGNLMRRVTFIPLNKIISRPVKKHVIEFAQKLVGKENVWPALTLVEYDSYYEPVMQFVFGQTLICRDLNVAKEVTYHRNILCRTVTLDGDIVEPDGVLSGGAAPKGPNVLFELSQMQFIEKQMTTCQIQMKSIDQELFSLGNNVNIYSKLSEDSVIRQCELDSCRKLLAQTTFQQNSDEVNSLKDNITQIEAELKHIEEKQIDLKNKLQDVESKLSDTNYREREKTSATIALQAAKQKADQSRINWQKHEQEFETLKLNIETLRKNIQGSIQKYEDAQEKLKKMKEEIQTLKELHEKATQEKNEIKTRIAEQKNLINSQNKELDQLMLKKSKLVKKNQDLSLEIKKKENEINKVRNEGKNSTKKIEGLVQQYVWISEDEKYFGTKNTRYDYSKEDPVKAAQKLSEMQTKKEKMERNLNIRAMTLLEGEEEKYNKTIHRKQIVEQDKQKIQSIICKMDEKKQEKIEKAWKVVNDNFSSIFSTLLMGAQARLKPMKRNNQLYGLEINVGFNGIWKESLTELSGGQRSLVALSLVLAMLKFSPAPLYILDEVDAALDMSHTQNIGNMLKVHFTSSQFIIVSLKDGMFNNANVLFRTKFEEGVSVVTRSVNSKLSSRCGK